MPSAVCVACSWRCIVLVIVAGAWTCLSPVAVPTPCLACPLVPDMSCPGLLRGHCIASAFVLNVPRFLRILFDVPCLPACLCAPVAGPCVAFPFRGSSTRCLHVPCVLPCPALAVALSVLVMTVIALPLYCLWPFVSCLSHTNVHVRVHLIVLSVLCIVCCVHVVLCPRLAFACVTVIALILHLPSYVIFPCVFGRPLPCFAFHDPSCGECHFCLLACPCPMLHAMALPVLSGPGLA